MQASRAAGKAAAPQPARHPFGPRPVGAVVPAVLRPAFRKRAPATAQLIMDWAVIVGPGLAAETTPRRLSAGTLVVACAGPMALELQHLSESLLERINRHMGHTLVQRLRFVQDPVVTVRPLPPAIAAAPAAQLAAENAVAGIPPGGLHDALAALGRAVLTRRMR
jgi:hypothetical protein